ncbi:corrinoid protein [Candidatus Neomarinimicrobiota bacterium]
MSEAERYGQIAENLINGNADRVKELISEAIATGEQPGDILENGLLLGMTEVGRRFKAEEFYIPEVLIAARAMTMGMEIIEPLLAASGVASRGKVLIGTVQGDLHDIGKNLASIMFQGAGFKVIDLGVDVPVEKFIQAAQTHEPEIIGLSALLSSTMVHMESVINGLRENGIPSKIIVGGAPITAEFARSIRADLFAPTAADAVDKVLAVLGN